MASLLLMDHEFWAHMIAYRLSGQSYMWRVTCYVSLTPASPISHQRVSEKLLFVLLNCRNANLWPIRRFSLPFLSLTIAHLLLSLLAEREGSICSVACHDFMSFFPYILYLPSWPPYIGARTCLSTIRQELTSTKTLFKRIALTLRRSCLLWREHLLFVNSSFSPRLNRDSDMRTSFFSIARPWKPSFKRTHAILTLDQSFSQLNLFVEVVPSMRAKCQYSETDVRQVCVCPL